MNDIYIYHHLGLGDHISCHGIVRYCCEQYKKVYLFVKEHNFENVRFMFNDIKNIEFIKGDDEFAQKYIISNNIRNIKIIGFNLIPNKNFELQFYEMAGVPIEYKHSKFFINRDLSKEKEIFNSLGLKKNNYIFAHHGEFKLRDGYIDNKDFKIVSPIGFGLFDWMYVIENAREIHCIDSSFICLIDCMKIEDNIPLYNHRYVRKYDESIKLYTHKKWIEIK